MNKLNNDSSLLITILGGFGFIGSRLCRRLLGAGYRVRVFDLPNASTAGVTDLLDHFEWIRGDHGNLKEVMDALDGAETVVHLIHTTVPGSSMSDPAYDVESNIASSAAWLSRIRETSVQRVIYLSSGGTVYGAPRTLPIAESHSLEPISSYGISKLACEKFVAMYCEMAGITHRILRPSNAFGEGQPSDRGQGVLAVYVDHIAKGKALEVWGNDASARDYVHVDDIVEAIVAMLSYDGDRNIFNVSTGMGHSVSDILTLLKKLVDALPETVRLPDRGFDVPANILDNSALRSATDWQPGVTFEDGVARMLRAAGVKTR